MRTASEHHVVIVDQTPDVPEPALRRRRDSERDLLIEVVERWADPVGLISLDGRLLYLNEAGRRMLGIVTVGDAHRTRFEDFFPEEDLGRVRSTVIPTALQQGYWEGELRLRSPAANAAVPVWYRLFPLQERPGHPVVLAGVACDISALRKNEYDLRTQIAQLQRSNRELEAFAYAASHDLQEPLRKVRAFGSRLRTTAAARLDDESRDCLDRIDRSVARMQTLIQDLLQLAKVTHQKPPFTSVDLAEVMRDVLADLELRIQETGAQVLVSELPSVLADPVQMQELFENLISNAIKFHRPGEPPTVRITSRNVEVPAAVAADGDASIGRCEIRVEDRGIGFDEQYLERIFGPFQRLHGPQEYEGSGVGLAICRKIVERHAGTLTAQSRLGEGAVFVVTLPLAPPPPPPPPPASSLGEETPTCIVSAGAMPETVAGMVSV